MQTTTNDRSLRLQSVWNALNMNLMRNYRAGILAGLLITFWIGPLLSSPLFAQSRSARMKVLREKMVDIAVKQAGVTDERVLSSMLATERHEFVPRKVLEHAYLDAGVPIGAGQTISSPFIVAYMTQTLDPQPTDKILEIGTGSGYQAAILSPLVNEVYSIEIVESLGKRAAKVLKKLKYKNVFTKIGDGYKGWEEHAPFDKIIVTCSPEDIPQPLVDQLKEGGMIVVPMGERHQQTLYQMVKKDGEMEIKALRPTLFVPMTGSAEEQRRVMPDPSNPTLLNTGFEEGMDENQFVKGWYYQRRLSLIESENAPGGKRYVEFMNDVPGQHAHVMQGFAIDGKKVSRVKFEATMASDNAVKGFHNEDIPVAALTFYDDDRRQLKKVMLGPILGTNGWEKRELNNVPVPLAAKEAIVRIGLFGATGKARFDEVRVTAVK